MEGVAALSFASNIFQLIDFASKLISKSCEIYRSVDGVTQDYIDIRIVTTDTKVLADRLKQSSPSTDQSLVQLSRDCCHVAEELLAALAKLQADGQATRWKSVRKALRTLWSKEKISEIEKRLSAFRDQLNLKVCLELKYV